MSSKDFIKGNMSLIVLSVISDGDMYGYEITRQVQELTSGAIQIKEGSLYPALHKLEKQGFIEGYWVQQGPGRPDRKYYRITGKGLGLVEQEKKQWKVYMGVMGRVLYGEGEN